MMRNDKLSILKMLEDEIKRTQEEVLYHAQRIRQGEESKRVFPKLRDELYELMRQRDEILSEIMAEGEVNGIPCIHVLMGGAK